MHVRCWARGGFSLAVVAGCLVLHPGTMRAQDDVTALGQAHGGARPPAGYYQFRATHPHAFEFSQQNGWIVRARAVATRRDALRAAALAVRPPRGAAGPAIAGAPEAFQPAGGVLHGDMNVPVFLALYANTDSASLASTINPAVMWQRLYDTAPAPPYSVHSYYLEISRDSLRVNGTVLDWIRVPGTDGSYEGPAGCDGICSASGVPTLIADLVTRADPSVDFGQFDNDGPDGIPNSGDDDGYVDAVVILHPEVGAECQLVTAGTANNIWSHRFYYSGWTGQDLVTNDSSASGGFIKIRDYIIQGVQGGDTGCTPNQPQAMGVVAHETGHLFGLPDLYDTGPNGSSGIGRWGLMGMGNERLPTSPAHMTAWSRAQLGWVTEIPISRDTDVVLSPIETSDTALVLPVSNSNEYFLLANRQRLGSDANLYSPGLLAWHVDSALMRSRLPSNTVNASFPHALDLVQADGLNQLDGQGASMSNTLRGDAGDPFPGATQNTRLDYDTKPSTARNDGTPTFLGVENITQVTPNGAMSMSLSFGKPTLVQATDTMAVFRLDLIPYHRFLGLLSDSMAHTLSIDSVQMTPDSARRFTWISWSDGGARSHSYTPPGRADTVIANLAAEYRVRAAVSGDGSVSATPTVALTTGALEPAGTPITLTAVPASGKVLDAWTGDTIATSAALALVMNRPFDVRATFVDSLRTVPFTAGTDSAVIGRYFAYTLRATGGVGGYTWALASGVLPPGITLQGSGGLAGLLTSTGAYHATATVVTGHLRKTVAVDFNVTAPTLDTAAVAGAVLGVGSGIAPDDERYLDLIGNRNGHLDVGDFLAWVRATAAASAGAIAPTKVGR